MAWIHRLNNFDLTTGLGSCQKCGEVKLKFIQGRPVCFNAYIEHRNKALKRRNQFSLLPRAKVEEKPLICERCGFKAEDPCQIDRHHRNYNPGNNEKSNLEWICANCHRLEHRRSKPNSTVYKPPWVK